MKIKYLPFIILLAALSVRATDTNLASIANQSATTNLLEKASSVIVETNTAKKVLLLPSGPTPGQIEKAKQRLHLLRPDMTGQQMRSTLGLKDSWFCFGRSGGPTSHYWTIEDMWGGHRLYMITTVKSKQLSGKTVQSYPLESVNLDGATWTADDNNKKQ